MINQFSIEIFGNILGISGMICFLLAYSMLQRNIWQAQSYRYFGANLAGSLLLIASLCIDWNLAAFMLELAWGVISLLGIIKLYHFSINRMNSIDRVSPPMARKITAFGSDFDTISRDIDREMVLKYSTNKEV